MPALSPLFGLLLTPSMGALSIAGGLVGKLAFQLLSSVALSALSAALQPKPKAAGLRTEATLAGGAVPESFMLGMTATSGVFAAPQMSHGRAGKTPLAYATYVIELAGIPGHQLLGLSLNNEVAEILGLDPHADYGQRIGGAYLDRAWIKYYDGTQTVADPMLLEKYPPPYVRPWLSDMIGAGICYAILTFRYDREVFQGWPICRFVLSGAPLYDPRADSSVGGAGAQRWDSPSTWQPSNNPAVQLYNVKRGVTFPAGDVWGGGVFDADLPLAAWMSEMDVADSLVDDGDAGTEPQFRTGVEVRVDDEPFSVQEELLKGCLGAVTETGGVWSLRLGAPQLPVLFITDDDIMTNDPEAFKPFPPIDQIKNSISATYPDPASNWEPTESRILTNADWELEDGGRRLSTVVSLPVVPYPVQVQRVTASLISDHRRMRRHTMTLPARAAALEALDTIAWTSVSNNYTAKLFEVADGVRDLRTQLVGVSLREVDPDDYDIPAALDRPAAPGRDVDRPSPQSVAGFAVAPTTINDGTNPRRPAIAVSWAADGADDARGVRLRIRVDGDTGAGDKLALYSVADGGAFLVDGILPGVTYQIRARYAVDRPTIWTEWATVTAPDVRLGDDDLDAELVGRIDTLRDWIDGGVTDLPGDLAGLTQSLAAEVATRIAENTLDSVRWRTARDDMRRLAAEVLDLAAHDTESREAIRQSLTVTLNDLSASVTADLLVVIDDQSATAAQVLQLEAANTVLESALTQAEVARAAGDDALSALISALAVGTAVQFDHAVIWYFDTTVEGWSGSPSPPTAVAGGYLKPAAAGYVTSPAGLAVASATYRQVRARLRRVGTPSWTGYVWWAGAGQGWDASRRVTADEPVWEGGIGLLTVDANWTGAVDAIRFDPADGADGSNYIEIDWIAVGRPAPGASSAELDAERSARIAADSAQVSDIVALDARIADAEGAGSATATALVALDVRVEDTEYGLQSVSARTTVLENAVDDPETGLAATVAALNLLESLVETTDGGTLKLLSEATRALQASLRRLAAEGIDQGARNATETQQVREYLATASQTLAARIDVTDGNVTIIAEAVTLLQAAIPGLATASALAALTVVVTDLGGDLTAEAAARQALAVTVAGNTAAISTEQTVRATADTALADAVMQLSAGDGDTLGTARMRFTAATGPAGYARVGMQARVDQNDAFRAAGFYIDVPNDDALPTIYAVEAEQFAIMDGGTGLIPFSVAGGVIQISGALRSANYSAGVSGFNIDATTGVIEATEVVDRRAIQRGLVSRSFVEVAAPMGQDDMDPRPNLSASFDIGTITIQLPSDPRDVPQMVVLRPFVGGKQPYLGSPVPGRVYGYAYEFRMRLQRSGATIVDSGWAFSPFWQFEWSSEGVRRVWYGCVPEIIRFYLENDGSGSMQASDSVVVDYRIYAERSGTGAPNSGVASATIQLDVEYFYR